jgi:hypothetical protein
LKGWGVEENKIKSFMWINIAASQGYRKGMEERDELMKTLTDLEITTGQKLSLDCFSKKFKDC